MKIILLNIFLLLFCYSATGQYIKSADFKISDGFNYLAFEYEDFKLHHVHRIKAYQYQLNKFGRVKKDSLLLLDKRFDDQTNTVSGLDHSWMIVTHAPSYKVWFNFSKAYDKNGRIIRETTTYIQNPKEEKKGFRQWIEKYKSGYQDFNESANIVNYTYDDKGNPTKKVYTFDKKHYLIFLTDTMAFANLKSSITYYEYTKNSLLSKVYEEKDSTRYFDTDGSLDKVKCNHCYPKYLSNHNFYDTSSGLLSFKQTYTKKGELHSKYYYQYDSLNRLIQRIDSTGWHLRKYSKTKKYPILKSNITYTYHPNGELKKEIVENQEINTKYLTQYNTDGYQILYCYTYNDENYCTKTEYLKEDGRITRIIKTTPSHTFKTEYYYNRKGFLSEVRSSENGKLVEVVRYYYE